MRYMRGVNQLFRGPRDIRNILYAPAPNMRDEQTRNQKSKRRGDEPLREASSMRFKNDKNNAECLCDAAVRK